MKASRRRAYLDAMGYDVWAVKPADPAPDRLQISPGQGSTLLVCGSAEESSTRLAGDFARALGGDPVWAWPDTGASPDCPTLEEVVEQYPFERVVIFGSRLGHRLFRGGTPEDSRSGAVMLAAGLDELAGSSASKRNLWKQFSEKFLT